MLIGLGGSVGALLRFLTASWIQRAIPSAFPLATLTVNLLGCLLFGVVVGLAEVHRLLTPEQRLFVLVGVLGSFTTFSTFAFEAVALAESSALGKALLYVALHVTVGCLAIWIGAAAVRLVS